MMTSWSSHGSRASTSRANGSSSESTFTAHPYRSAQELKSFSISGPPALCLVRDVGQHRAMLEECRKRVHPCSKRPLEIPIPCSEECECKHLDVVPPHSRTVPNY